MNQTIEAIRKVGEKYGRKSSKRLKGYNFMTPHLIGVYSHEGITFELSEGTGFNREQIIGVTFFDSDGDKSTCCSSLFEVEQVLMNALA